jgi:anti-sigma regulatory factor (Ser/Thr protein kinase)
MGKLCDKCAYEGSPLDFTHVFPLGPMAPRQARRSLEPLIGLVPPRIFLDVQIITSELVTNTVRHSGGGEGDPVTVRVDCTEERVRLEVEDGGPGFSPIFGTPTPSSTKGWGLYLVDRLSDRWGATPAGRVWAEIDLPVQSGR